LIYRNENKKGHLYPGSVIDNHNH